MGLDMFLYKRKNGTKTLEEVAYWRKANQIRNWIVQNTEYEADADCEEYLLNKETLENLVSDCKAVIAENTLADELLPTKSGFFFGSTEYDDWYFEDLKSTVKQVEKVLKETDWDNEDIYYYEWW